MHNYHFILDEATIKVLMEIFSRGSQKSLTEGLKEIFKDFFCRIKKFHFFGRDQGRRYLLINPDLKVPRRDLWLPMSGQVFNKLRRIQCEMNFLSIAQVVRAVIEEYINACGEGQSADECWMRSGTPSFALFYSQEDIIQHMRSDHRFLLLQFKEFVII